MSGAAEPPVSIIVQTRVRAGQDAEFARWQAGTSAAVAAQPGFLEESVLPPHPPAQPDWVILQRFATQSDAVRWLNSPARQALLAEAADILAGFDDVHLVRDQARGALPAPVSMVIATRIKPGQEAAYRQWEQRIAAAQAKAPGFQGYRFEPPIPGVQEDWLSILRFDSEQTLEAWMASPERQRLLADSLAFTEALHTRAVRTGFDAWFAGSAGTEPAPAAWKQNMLVLALLYPVVFLFGLAIQTPLLIGVLGMPFWSALFLGNVASVLLLSRLVPWSMRLLGWWLTPTGTRQPVRNVAGAALMLAVYALCLAAFARL